MARILFLHESAFEFLGVLTLCGYLEEKGHEVEVLIASEEGSDFWDKVRDFKPDWAGFSTIFSLHQESYALAKEIKRRFGTKTVFGGPYVSYEPKGIHREEVDVIIRGEGEEALLDLLNASDKGEDYSNIKNVWTIIDGKEKFNPPRPFETDLDKYPVPDRKYYYKYPYLRKQHLKHFISGRDCPYNCYFCFNHEFRKLYQVGAFKLRRRSPEHVMEELRQVKANYPLVTLAFDDDVFPIDLVWLEEFLPKYRKEIGVPFSCNIHACMVKKDVVKLLADNSCRHVMMGLESGNPRVRREVLGKKFSNQQFLNAADMLHRQGIKIMTYNILGNPTETLEEALDTVKMNNAAKIDYPWWSIYQPIMGTRTTQIAIDHGYISADFNTDRIMESIFNRSYLNQPEIREVERLHKLFLLGVKFKFMIPVIKRMSKWNLMPVYTQIFLVSYFYRHWKESGMNFFKMLLIGIKQLKKY